jgi:hypothetical protein
VAAWFGIAAKQAKQAGQVSGHSVRLEATQDLLALNMDQAVDRIMVVIAMSSGRFSESPTVGADELYFSG